MKCDRGVWVILVIFAACWRKSDAETRCNDHLKIHKHGASFPSSSTVAISSLENCVCNPNICIRKCCPIGYRMKDTNCVRVENDGGFEVWLFVQTVRYILTVSKHSRGAYFISRYGQDIFTPTWCGKISIFKLFRYF